MSAKRLFVFAALGAALVLGAPPRELRATSEIALSEEQMAEAAQWIAAAQVKASRAEWIDGELWTAVQLRVSSTLKGPVSDAATLLLLGGIDAERGIGSLVPGAPLLPVGARILVMGRRSEIAADAYEPIGVMQGIWIDGVASSEPGAQAVIPARGPAPREGVAAVAARVRSILARANASAPAQESR